MAKKPNRKTPGQRQADLVRLASMPEFKRFLFEIGRTTGIWTPTTDTSEHRSLIETARRNVGLEIFQMVEDALGEPHESGLALATIITVLLEEAKPSQGASDERSDDDPEQYDRYNL